MPAIVIENTSYQVSPDQNALEACLSLKMDLPYFCWHPAMGSVGACRQCAVKQYRDAHDERGKIVMACMTPVTEGMRISLADPDARAFRAGIIEGLMQNHPHDCPVCDEGGECHLQDMTVMTGHDYRRYRFPKRTFRNQELGPFLNHEMNRCIQCYRCVRFYRDYAGGDDFNVFKLRDIAYFGRQADGVLENEFAGNLVEVCPTGVFTDKTLKRHYTRKWDLTMAPSICVHCALGCNTTAGSRYGMLRRIVNRYHGAVNGYFLCDRGRYGYEFVNSEQRISTPTLRVDGVSQPIGRDRALEHVGRLLSGARGVIGIGSPRASLEANFALRTLVGTERFATGMADAEARLVARMVELLRAGPAHVPSMRDTEGYDAVLVLGEDVTNSAPRLALSLRQAARQRSFAEARQRHIPLWQDQSVRELAQHQHGPFFIASVNATRLDDVATAHHRAAPDDIARLGFAIAHHLDASAPAVAGLSSDAAALAHQWATTLAESERPLVVSGAGCLHESVIEAAASIARALCRAGTPAGLTFTMPECNSVGLALMGGGPLESAVDAIANGTADTVIVLENDLARRLPAPRMDALLHAGIHLVALDALENATTAGAEVVFPAGTFAESDGTLVNNEGRAQRFFQPLPPHGEVQESWRWLAGIMAAVGGAGASWHELDDVIRALTDAIPALAAAAQAAPMAGFRLDGAKVPREPHRYSGRTSIHANVDVSEPEPPHDPDSALSYTMEGSSEQPPAALIPFFWAPGWNSIQSVNTFQTEIASTLDGGDPGVRLIEPASTGHEYHPAPIPPAFQPRAGEWLLVPLHHIYGSEELSSAAPAVAALAPAPYVAVNERDAQQLAVRAGDLVDITLDGVPYRFPVRIAPALPGGVAGVPVGLPGVPTLTRPTWSAIVRRT